MATYHHLNYSAVKFLFVSKSDVKSCRRLINYCTMCMCSNHPGYPYYSSYSYSISSTAHSWAIYAFVYLIIFIYSLNWLTVKPRGPKTGCCGGCRNRGSFRRSTSKQIMPAGMALSPNCRCGQRPAYQSNSSRSVSRSPVRRPTSSASAGRRPHPPAPALARSRGSLDHRWRSNPSGDPFRFYRSRLARTTFYP